MLTRQGATRLIETEFNRLVKININFPDRTPISPVVYRPTELIMAEKTVATLLNQDGDEWMKDLTATFRMAHITESQALKIISIFLEGHPKQWFIESITIFESWSVFKAQFIHTYSSPSSKQLASNRLRTRQQRQDEAVIEYYTDVMKLCKLVDPNMTDVSKLDHLYHGLKSSLMKDVLREAPSTPSGFLEQARREENLDRLVTTAAQQANDDDTEATTYSNNSLYRSPQSAESMLYQNSSNMYSKAQELFNNVKIIVSNIRRSHKQQNLSKKLILYSDTRFYGAYAMLNVFSSIFDELVQILDSKLLTTYSRINDDFLLDICRFLLLFDTVIKALSDDRRPTLHRVLPFKQYLINKCEIDNDDNEDLKQVKCFLGKRLDEKWELTDEHLIVAVLHPNNKHLHKSPHLKEREILLLKQEMFKRHDRFSSTTTSTVAGLPDTLSTTSSTCSSSISSTSVTKSVCLDARDILLMEVFHKPPSVPEKESC
ncbi:unnamed protein product [Rotaria sp. Silwood2]|nr:unnamed protein product [Rotaria sp. Silwood2]